MKLPFEASLKSVFRLVLPGFVLSLGLYPLLHELTQLFHVEASPEVLVTVSTVTLGWLFVTLDMHIYMVIEGRRYWPDWLRVPLQTREAKRLEHLERMVDRTEHSNPSEYREASVELRRFPIDPDNEARSAEYPTRLGNLLAAYEGYPKLVYGMNAVFYWPRIWVAMDKDLREEIDSQQALADSATYVATALALCGALAFLYAGIGILPIPSVNWLPRPLASGLLGLASLAAARLLYRLSLHTHAQFGELFKAVFDMRRTSISVDDVVNEVTEIARLPYPKSARERYRIAWRYLQNYRIQTPDGASVRPGQVRQAMLLRTSGAASGTQGGTHGSDRE